MTDRTTLVEELFRQKNGSSDLTGLRALLEDASRQGASHALERLGLDDEAARKDMADLRELLSAWRDAKHTARRAVIGWVVRVGLALLVIGLAVKLGLPELVLR